MEGKNRFFALQQKSLTICHAAGSLTGKQIQGRRQLFRVNGRIPAAAGVGKFGAVAAGQVNSLDWKHAFQVIYIPAAYHGQGDPALSGKAPERPQKAGPGQGKFGPVFKRYQGSVVVSH